MIIDKIVVPLTIQEKLASKHEVTIDEARYVLLSQPRIRFAEKGPVAGEDVYAAFGRTFPGRYLVVYLVHKTSNGTAIITSVRDMVRKVRRQYGRK